MERTESNSKWIGATLGAAFLASLCCITPILAIIAGIGGAASAFSWMEPFRPYLIGLTVLVLGFAWYQKLKPKKAAVDCACDDEEEKPFLQSKTFLGIVTALAVLLLSFPYYSDAFFLAPAKDVAVVAKADLQEASLRIQGMTCEGCESSVNYALTSKAGVIEANSDYQTGTALVKYDASVVGPDALKEVIEKEVGYKVTKMEIVQQ
ncbi:mercuric transport protein MerTP [Pontibacter sp. E15-1]|uniref:mercuric transport protein MerTP n=1 Tax=Pontibacter sp. E15-1 TaxID=2919918 RepID=UPI001F4FE6C9|nr:mercuric transport protein MerTP [Pontibacter sp. E15-1]MCJ8166033.1 mercuric transport protein MerTP [Pontibacter sp. E15-1]